MSSTHTTGVQPAYDPQSGTYELALDHDSSWKVSTTIVLALSELTGEEPREMRPLGRDIAPEALDRHLTGRCDGAELSFEYHGHHVTIHGEGQVEFTPLQEREF